MKIIVLKDYYPKPCGETTAIEISDELFSLLMRLDRDWKLLERKSKRYHDKNGYEEGKTEWNTSPNDDAVERDAISLVETKRLRALLSALTDTQRRRVQAYFFEGLTYAQIALVEGTSLQAVQKSIRDALRKIKNIF